MPKFDVVALVRELDKLGLKLSAIRHMDGRVRLYRWRQMNYWQNEADVQRLWNASVGDDEASINYLAESLVKLDGKANDMPPSSSHAA